jgi:hypothetical protein
MTYLKLIPLAALATMVAGCATTPTGYASNDEWGYHDRASYERYGNYDYDRPDPRQNGYYADQYYRNDRRYRERQLRDDDRVYRGRDGRYYCRRSDGTTGLIVGGVVGGVLGNIIAPGESRTLGTVIGAIGGAAVGAAVDGNRNVRCR